MTDIDELLGLANELDDIADFPPSLTIARRVRTVAAALRAALAAQPVTVCEGWWHPNVKSGQVHDHPAAPGQSWSTASHRLCEPVYTRRAAAGLATPEEET